MRPRQTRTDEPKKIGIFETKTHLSELIERVERGETFHITKRGHTVAVLQPPVPDRLPLVRGCARNAGYRMAPDFDSTSDDFADYV